MIKQAPQDHAKSKSPRPSDHVVEWIEMDQTVFVGVQCFMNLWYDSLDSLTISKSNIMLRDCEWEDCDSHDRNKSWSKQNQSNTLLEVGHSGGKGIPLDLDGRKPCPETYGNSRNNLKQAILKIPSLEEWPIGAVCSTCFTSVATLCGPFRERYVLQVKGHGKKTATSGACSGQHQPPREVSSKHAKTDKSLSKARNT